MKLRTLPSAMKLSGKRILLRVDWNVPMAGGTQPEDSLKIERSIATIRELSRRGAVVIVLTHLGRPKGHESVFSTGHLVPLVRAHYGLSVIFHSASISHPGERAALKAALQEARPGSVHLMENVRFEAGEEKNDSKLAKQYAELGNLFVNDAFASSHRAHASVVGIAKVLPAYAGPSLVAEVEALSRLITKPKKPFVAVIGGFKLSTKIPVLRALLAMCDRVLVGGAMAVTLGAAKKVPAGKSFVEKESIPLAKTLVKNTKIGLPLDVVVTRKLVPHPSLRHVMAEDVGAQDIVVDVGPRTLKAWSEEIQGAKMLLWNGPVGVSEIRSCGAGSRFLARVMGARAKGPAFGVVGGGDTIPVVFATKTEKQFDHVSTGGGALLEFLAKKGKLPGLIPLMPKK